MIKVFLIMTDLENSYLELLCCLMTQKFEDSETGRFETKKKKKFRKNTSFTERKKSVEVIVTRCP